MLKRVLILLLLAFALVGWALALTSVHVVRTPERVVVVPKNRVGVAGTYADVRGWSADDARGSPVARRLVETGKREHLAHISGLDLDESR